MKRCGEDHVFKRSLVSCDTSASGPSISDPAPNRMPFVFQSVHVGNPLELKAYKDL